MTKDEIINAAFKVWGCNYYRKTSLSQLAGELKVSKPALYRHFINKQDLSAAMTERFLNEFAVSIKDDLKKAKEMEPDEGILTIIGSISRYFGQNVFALIFSIMSFYDRNVDKSFISQQLKERGADMAVLQEIILKKYPAETSIIRLIFNSLTFFMSAFHKKNNSMKNPPSQEDIEKVNITICGIIKHGLGFFDQKSKNKATLDFEKLEKFVSEMTLNAQAEPFFKAVAEAVAEAGPWDVSMDMVAKKIGMSKSSLYGHFKSRKDMLRRLFITEFKRIIEFAKQGIALSSDPAEQLYLGLFSISVYLQERQEILIAMDWIRTRKLNLGKPDKNIELFRLFEDVEIAQLRNASDEEKQRASHWFLFLLINILTHPMEVQMNSEDKNVNYNIETLYKFITLGLGGFVQ